MNHQLFAFCPKTNQLDCGVGDSKTNYNMQLTATSTEATISADDIQYVNTITVPLTREYESCYYEIKAGELTEEDITQLNAQGPDGIRMKLKINTADQMNVYVYGGDSRFTATESIVEGNAALKAGRTYTVDYQTGMLLVAYPTENA